LVSIPEEGVKGAAGNWRNGKKVMALLLYYHDKYDA
jgi:hypothetical protein